MKESLPNYAVPPGLMLAEWLEEHDMTQTHLAERLGRSTKHVNQVINGVASLSHEFALDLELVTGISARLWVNMEANYRADVARLSREQVAEEDRAWLGSLPLAELRKRHCIKATMRDPSALLQEVLGFFGVSNRDAWDHVYGRPAALYRASQAHVQHPGAVATWLRLGELEAEQLDVSPTNLSLLRHALPEVRSLSRGTDGEKIVPELKDRLGKCGVVLLLIPDVPGTRLYGATRWLGGHAVVQLSLRRKTDDQFWFTLLHELAHVLLHPRDAIYIAGDGNSSPMEDEANTFSADLLVPPSELGRLRDVTRLDDVNELAAEWGISPGVVVGRIHREKFQTYDWGARLKRTITFPA